MQATATQTQPSLFDQPLSRNRDSVTSFEAAEDLKQSGRYRRQLWRVFHALRKKQGSTSLELSAELGFDDRYVCSRRLADLRRRRMVCNGAKRLCRVSGKRCLTWWIATRWGEKVAKRAAGKPRAQTERPAPKRRERKPDAKVMTVAERQQFRLRMLADATPSVRRFLENVSRGGGAKS